MTHRPNAAVVGDGGFVAYGTGDDLDRFSWFELDAGTSSDLRSVAILEVNPMRFLVAGDGILLHGSELEFGEFEWVEPMAPDGGWGSLRAVYLDDPPSFASPDEQMLIVVGDDGRLLTSNIAAMDWTVEPLATTAHLLCACASGAYGVGGTWAKHDGGSWLLTRLDPARDYVACDYDLLATSDGHVHDIGVDATVDLDWRPRAIAHRYIVGDDGHAVRFELAGPEEF